MNILDKLKKLGAEIGKIELQRHSGIPISILTLIMKKKEFKELQIRYRKEKLGY